MIEDYYETKTVTVVCTFAVKWRKERDDCKQEALRLARELTVDGGGATAGGCYGCKLVNVEVPK